MHTLILTGEDVHLLLRHVGLDAFMDALIERLRRAISEFDETATVIPVRSGFAYTQPAEGLIEWMPCLRQGDHVVLKVVGYHPTNARTNGLPTVVSTVSAYDATSGHLKAVTDATLLTALRTGAASAVASDVLARLEARTLGLIGVGAQAVTQLHALTRVRPIERVLFYDSDPAASASFASRVAAFASELSLHAASVDEVIEASDIVCTATSVGVGEGPVFGNVAPQPWCHINAVGSDFPGKVEVPRPLLEQSLVCPDFRLQAVAEGECQQLEPGEIGPGLADLVREADQYVSARDALTVFDSTGWALEDDVAMGLLVELAEPLGLGTRLPIEAVNGDALNPYDFATVDAQTREPHRLAS